MRERVREKLRESLAEAVQRSAASDAQPGPGEGDSTTLPPQRCDVGLVFALGLEAGGLVDRMVDRVSTQGAKLTEHVGRVDGRRVAIVETGVGRKAAELGCRDLVEVRRPDWVVSAGFAGALCSSVKRGHIVMANRVADPSGRSLAVGLQLGEQSAAAKPSLHVGRLLTVDRLITDPEEKKRLGQQHDALACDMESFAVAEVCREAQVRFLSVRIISDAVDDELPPELVNLVKQKSVAGKLGAITGAIWQRPGNIKTMWKLNSQAIKLSERLAHFLRGALPQLT
jgi:adenosylhomocysteine nucleosidase